MKKKTYIVSTYDNYYEKIVTRETYFLWLLKLKYMREGYMVYAFPTMWMAKIYYKFTGKGIYKGTNVTFEKRIPGSDQVTYWMPWMNFN